MSRALSQAIVFLVVLVAILPYESACQRSSSGPGAKRSASVATGVQHPGSRVRSEHRRASAVFARLGAKPDFEALPYLLHYLHDGRMEFRIRAVE
ncbi:MAG: hypothetical protein ABIK62_02140, partial [candidate division WOR-3 bacterium]